MCTERAQERELERKRGGKGRKGEKERDKEKNLGAKKPKLALVARPPWPSYRQATFFCPTKRYSSYTCTVDPLLWKRLQGTEKCFHKRGCFHRGAGHLTLFIYTVLQKTMQGALRTLLTRAKQASTASTNKCLGRPLRVRQLGQFHEHGLEFDKALSLERGLPSPADA